MSKVVRSVKNVTKGYSAVEVKVRNATSNDAWGPTSTEMGEIAQITFNSSSDFYDIMNMLDKRLNDKGKNWRHVLKSLKVLDYCLHEGSELVVTWARKNIYVVRTLREFQYIDEDGRDVGNSVRVSAKELTSLIMDEDRLRAERHDRKLWKSRVTGLEEFGPPPGAPGGSDPSRNRRNDRRNRKDDEDDVEYKLAIEASKNEAEEAAKRRAKGSAPSADDDDLARAIKLSREEEDLRRRELEETNAKSLFDDTPAQPQPTGYNQGYQQQPAVDWFGNSIDPQQPQSTGYLNNIYSQPTGFQGQQTGYQNGYGYGQYQQPQQTAFDQSQFQQPQQNFMQPQQTAFNVNNPYSTQNSMFQDQNQQQIQQPQNAAQPGSNNPWASSGGSMDDIRPQQTGSNNPFASSFNRPQTAQPQRTNTLSALQEQKTQTQFNNQFNQPPPMPSMPTAYQQQQPQQKQQDPQDPHRANLNALLSSGEGQDTFGNTGELRIPAQHTAPGTFINSAGAGGNRIQANQTGNPFMSNQFTGMPQQNRMAPAQTGPIGGFGGGFGSANPFGQQRQGQQPQSGSLIDL